MSRHAQVDKIQCRQCWCGQSKVVNTVISEVTYHGKKHTIIKRYRQCRHCGFRWPTLEVNEEDAQQALGILPAEEGQVGRPRKAPPEELEVISPLPDEHPAPPANPFLAAGQETTSPKETRRPQRKRK